MKTKLLSLILAAFSFTGFSAQTFTANGINYKITDAVAKTVEVAPAALNYSGNITIPATVAYNAENYAVTALGKQAFENGYFTSLSLPEGLLTIGERAVAGCSQLPSLSIPASVTAIAPDALLYTANKLNSLTVAATNAHYKSVNNVLFTKDGKTLLVYANKAVTAYTVPAGVTALADHAFNSSDIVSVVLPDGVQTIGNRAFERCYNLSQINFPTTLQSIGEWAFCYSVLSSAILPDNISVIGDWAFYYCEKMKNLHLPAQLTEVKQYCFSYCKLVPSVEIPEGVKVIYGDGFSYISELTSVVIPSTMETIYHYAFSDNPKLEKITCKASVPPVLDPVGYGKGWVFGQRQSQITLYVPQGSKAAYQAAEVWKDFKEK